MAGDKEKDKEKQGDLIQFLDDQVWCDSLTINEVKIFLYYTELVNFKGKEIIAEIGEVGEALYLVVTGEVTLYRDQNSSSEVGRIKEGEIMGVQHKEHPVHGVQFHPESILTREGKQLLQNFLDL